MLDSFEKEAKLHERRAARQRQMRLMEEAASGMPLSSEGGSAPSVDLLGGDGGGESALPPTMSDIENAGRGGGAGNQFSIDDDDADDEDAGPPSVFTTTDASRHLWASKTSRDMSLDAEKMGFIAGGGGGGGANSGADTPTRSGSGGSSSWMSGFGAGGGNGGGGSSRRSRAPDREHDESRELILMASRRLRDVTPQRNNMSSFQVDIEEEGMGDDDEDFRQRSSIKLPTCCLLHRRAICASIMVLTLFVALIASTEPVRKNRGDSSTKSQEGGSSAPWAIPPPSVEGGSGGKGGGGEQQEIDYERFNRIKDRILEHGVSHASDLEETYTPQYRALVWLVRDDPRRLDLPPLDDETAGVSGADVDAEQSLFQRYALATLWFQTNDLQIVKQSMTGRDVEDPFDEPFDPLDLTLDDIRWRNSDNWMSSKGLCLWHGVTCHPHGKYGQKYDGDFYVEILNLTSNNVYGILPREVFTGFGKLKALDLSQNELEGTIGYELGMLKDLEGKLAALFLKQGKCTSCAHL